MSIPEWLVAYRTTNPRSVPAKNNEGHRLNGLPGIQVCHNLATTNTEIWMRPCVICGLPLKKEWLNMCLGCWTEQTIMEILKLDHKT